MSAASYSITAKGDGAEALLYSHIGYGGAKAADLSAELKAHEGKPLTLRIHSPGGDVFEGTAIHGVVTRHAAGVTTAIDGLAASMATIVALAGKKVTMASNAMFMVHNPVTFAIGEAADMDAASGLLNKIRDTMVAVYTAKTKKTVAQVKAWMDAETWFTAAEAKAAGFVDEITGAIPVKASFDLSTFKNLPAPAAVFAATPKLTTEQAAIVVNTQGGGGKTLTPAAYHALSQKERVEFFLAGGSLTDSAGRPPTGLDKTRAAFARQAALRNQPKTTK